MLRNFNFLILIFLTHLSSMASQQQANVPLNGMYETSITHNKNYNNKFRDVILEATFTSPSGKKTPFWGFF